MLDCTDVNKLVEDGAGRRQDFVLLSLLTQWALDCLKQIKDERRQRFPREQEAILFDKVKAQVKIVRNDLIQIAIQDLKFIGVVLRDYKVGENVDFNKFLVECLLSSYKSISNEIKRNVRKASEQKFADFLQPDTQNELDQHLHSSNKAKIDTYLNIRRDADSLYTIYYTIGSVEPIIEVNQISIQEKRLAMQRAFHITGEYVKDTQSTPNLSSDVRQSLEEKGVPTKALSRYRDTLAHYQVFPLIEGDDNQVKELFDEYFLPIQEVIKSTIIETEDSFVEKIIEENGKESKIDKSVVERLIESKSRKGVQGLEECIRTMQSEDKYRSMSDENKKFVDEVYQTVQRMKSMDFPVDPVKSPEGTLSEKKPKLSDSITEYINKSKLEAYNQLRDEVAPSLESYVGSLESLHSDVLKITQVIDRLSYKDTSSPNNSILDNFLSLPILGNIYVEMKKGTSNNQIIGSSLKKQLEQYFDAESFKNNDVYGEFKDSEPENLIDLLNNNISGEDANKEKLIGFFESIGKSQDNYILPEEYEQLVKGLGINDKLKEKLFSYSVGWREEKCVDLLKKNPPALKAIYDSILEGKSIRSSVCDKFTVEGGLPWELRNSIQQRVYRINQQIEELYSRRAREESVVLTKVNDPYAVESQIINVYSLSERASDQKRGNRKRKGGEEKNFEMKKLRNFLSHGDALISIEDHKYIAEQLVRIKNQEGVINMLNDPNITPEKIERTMDSMQSHVGLKNIRELLCPLSQPRKRPRSVGESCLTWEEIDKFNEGGAENRDPDNIVIDSEKFLSSILSELETNEEKFSNFIALASESEVIGDHKDKVNMLTDNHRYLGHLERVGEVSGMVMHAMMAKNLVGDLLRGDYKDVAINLGFLSGSPVLSKVADVAAMKGAGLILEGSELLGKSLRFASPFLSRGVTGFIAWDLFTQVKEYRKGDKDALVPIIGDSVQIATDAAEIGVEVAEVFGVLEGVSAVTGPIGMAIAAVVFVGSDVYTTVRKIEKIDEYIHLTEWQKITEGSRAFLGLRNSDDVEGLIEEKDANNQAVKYAIGFLKSNPHIQRYVFPSIKVEYTADIVPCPVFEIFPVCLLKKSLLPRRSHSTNILNNVVSLDEKGYDITWSRTRPDNVEGIDLFCLPQGDSESAPESGTYYCDGAIGVEYTNDRTRNDTLISLGDGYDVIIGFQGSSNILVFGAGHKDMTGGNKDDNFIFGGQNVDAVYDIGIEGTIDGRGGIDTIDVSELTPDYEWSERLGRYQVSADFRKGIFKDTSKVALNIHNINVFLGRKGGVDQVVAACDTKHVDGRGGENKNYLDSIIIPKDDACSYDTKVTVNPYTKVTNNATSGKFLYFVNGENGKEAYIELGPSSQSYNTFIFNYTLTDVAGIDKSEKNITFSFVEEFYKREKKIDVNNSFNLTVNGADNNITTYHLIDSTKIVMGQNNVYAMQNTEKPIASLVKDYSSIADKSQMYVFVRSHVEVLTVGHGHADVLRNNPKARASHLVGGGGENVFVITSGHEKLTLAKLPISDVVIYDLDQENKIDTLDLRKITEQLKKDINREINAEVSKIHSDLRINLSLDDEFKREVVRIRLKGALENNWYKRVHIVIDSIFVIEEILDDFQLTPQPIIFDNNRKTIYVINPTDVGKGGKIRVKKEIGDYIFARDNDALIVTNALSSSAKKNNLFTIILNDFYYGNNRDNMQSLNIEFNNQKIFLRKEIQRINSAGNFRELMRKVTFDSYKAVGCAINEQKLFEAIEGNNIGAVKELLDHGVSIDVRNNDGQTPLHTAAKSGKLEIVKYLIEEKGADIDVWDDWRKVPLHYAVISGTLEVVKYLIEEKGANVEVKDGFLRVPLHLAAEYNRLEVVKYLIEEKGANVNVRDRFKRVPFHLAVNDGRLEVVKYLVEEIGVHVNVHDDWGNVALHYAAEIGSLEVVKYLIEKGADSNVRSDMRRTPLHLAAWIGSLEVVKYLIEEKGADVHVMDWFTKLPLHYAGSNGNLEVVKYLIEEKGANVNQKDESGKLPLHYAVISGNLELVKYLIEEKGANVTAKDFLCRVPLHLAAEYNRLEVVEYLIEEKGADIDVRDRFKKVPLHLAANDGRLEVVKYLVEEKGADVNVKADWGMLPLHYAVISGNLEVVKYLIEEKGANVNVGDDMNKAPLHLATEYNRLKVVTYLLEEKGARVNVQDSVDWVPLQFATNYGRLEVVKYLVEERSDVDVRDYSKKIPSYLAANVDKLWIVKYLIEENGDNFDVRDIYGYIPLHLAATDGRLEVVKYLVEKGADVNLKDNVGTTPLHYVADHGNIEMAKYLIEKGAKIGLESKTDLNILKRYDYKHEVDSIVKKLTERLFDAVKYDDFGEVQDLINQGINVNDADSDGRTLLHFAASNGKLKVVKYLTEIKGVDLNVKDNKGRTPFDKAVEHEHIDIMKYLIRKVNEKREKPRQHKRSPHHSSRRLLTTDSSNQPEIATRNASEKSSWINDLVGPIVKLQESSAPLETASSNYPIRYKRHNDHSRHEDGMHMHRVRHRHRRVQKRNVKYQDSHYYIEQPKIAASSGARPSSWINGLLDWIKEKGGGLVSSVVDTFAAKESEDSKLGGIHACSVMLEKMCCATIPNIPQSNTSQGVPKRNIPYTSWSGRSTNQEKVTSNVTDAPEMNTTVLNNALILGDLAVRLVNGTRHKQPIHENLLSLREKSMRFIDENMIMRTIEQGIEKFGGPDTNMDV